MSCRKGKGFKGGREWGGRIINKECIVGGEVTLLGRGLWIGVGLSVRLPPSADQEMPGLSVKYHIPGKVETVFGLGIKSYLLPWGLTRLIPF